ncbi:hypothetical protein JKG47_00380 [Acidithiobacillus sp. MC6.1]|nr:hypothetical protein [Acidithiobacillus sp. MC6.1]
MEKRMTGRRNVSTAGGSLADGGLAGGSPAGGSLAGGSLACCFDLLFKWISVRDQQAL